MVRPGSRGGCGGLALSARVSDSGPATLIGSASDPAAKARLPSLHGACRLLLVLGAGSIPISIVLAQTFLYLGLVLWLAGVVARGRWSVFRQPLVLGAALFFVVCALSGLTGLHGAHAASKLYRLAFLLLIPAVPDLFREAPRWGYYLLGAFVFGTVLLSIYDMVRVPHQVATLHAKDMAHTGNMRDPQFYMVATITLAVGFLSAKRLEHRVLCIAPIVFCLIGLFLHSKMGSVLGLGCALLAMVFVFRRFAILAALAVVVGGVLLAHAPTRHRVIHKVQNEFDPGYGARGTLWTVVAPGFIKAHPFGAGYKSTEYADLVKFKGPHHMEVGLEHLHNNLLQMQAELGFLGPLVWLPWMAAAFWVMWRGRADLVGRVVLLAFLALFMNGMMEYNFGDSEPFMLFCLLMGLALLPCSDEQGLSIQT